MLRIALKNIGLLFLPLLLTLILQPLPVFAEGADEMVPDPGVIIVGGDRDYPPYEFLDKNGRPAGYNVDLTRAIADVMGMKVEFRFGSWSEMRKGLSDGSINILQGISYSESAQEHWISPLRIPSSITPSLPGRGRPGKLPRGAARQEGDRVSRRHHARSAAPHGVR